MLVPLRPHHLIHLTRGTLQRHVRTLLLQMLFHRILRRHSRAAIKRAAGRRQRPRSRVTLLQVLLMVLVAEAGVALGADELEAVKIFGQLFVVFGDFEARYVFFTLGANLVAEGFDAGAT